MINKSLAPDSPSQTLGPWLALLSISLVSFLIALLQSSSSVAIPAISEDLGAGAVLAAWIPTAFVLATVVLLLPAGRWADRHGRKRVYLLGLLVLAAATLMAGLSPTIEWLLLSRALQGFGAAMAFATSMALVASLFGVANRGMALGLATGALYLGLSFGPLLGGWLTQYHGWRSVFLLPVAFILAACVLVHFNVKDGFRASAAMAAGEAPRPRLDLAMLGQNRLLSRSLLASICCYSSSYPLVFLFSLFLQYNKGMTPVGAGTVMIVQALTMALVAPLAGRFSDRVEPRLIATAGCLLMAAAFAALSGLSANTPVYLIVLGLLMVGLGFGLFTTPNNNAALSSIGQSQLGMGTALLSLSRVTGQLLGTAVVLLLIAAFIGDAPIDATQYRALTQVTRGTLAMATVATLLAAFFSYTRGNVR